MLLLDSLRLLLADVIGVNLLDRVGSGYGHAYVVVDHVFHERRAVDEYDLAVDSRCELKGISGE